MANNYVFGSKIETGGWWSYHETPQQMWDRDDHVIDPAGLVRWKMGNPVPKDIVVAWGDVGLLTPDQRDLGIEAHDAYLNAFFAAYRANQPSEPTAEQRFGAVQHTAPASRSLT